MSARSLTITGVNGFVGRHLAKKANELGLIVRGVSKDLEVAPSVLPFVDEYFSADLTEEFPIGALSDVIIHLAGLAAVGQSFENPQLYIEANSSMVTNIAETIITNRSTSHVQLIGVSSGSVYAPNTHGEPIDETASLYFSSPYVVSKVLIENQLSYYQNLGIDVVVVRPFNHIGPGQGSGFLLPDLNSRLKLLQSDEALLVGNLETARDYLDVRDVVEAYLAIALSDTHQNMIYNVSSGRSVTGFQILESLCFSLAREVPSLEIDPSRIRPNEIQTIVGSAERIRNEFGWAPTYDLRQTIDDFLGGEIFN